jgi:hypothetical protein
VDAGEIIMAIAVPIDPHLLRHLDSGCQPSGRGRLHLHGLALRTLGLGVRTLNKAKAVA